MVAYASTGIDVVVLKGQPMRIGVFLVEQFAGHHVFGLDGADPADVIVFGSVQ